MRKARHLKTVVQHHIVIDDGVSLVEAITPPEPVSAADWQGYAAGAFLQRLAETQQQLDDEDAAQNSKLKLES